MKTKDKNRHQGLSVNNNEGARSPDKEEKVRDDHSGKRERLSEDSDLEKSLSRGYFPDGPGGNYRGV